MSISPVDQTPFGGSGAAPYAGAASAPRVDGAFGPAAALELELMVLAKSVDAPGAGSVDMRV